MLYLYLTLSHLIGDFILQPNKLIFWKNKSPIGTLVHVLILLAVNFFFLFPFFGNIGFLSGLLTVYLVHLIEDIFKIEYVKKYPNKEFAAFIFDQVVHFTTFTIFYFYFVDAIPLLNNKMFAFLYSDYWVALALIIAVSSTYVYDICEFEIKRIKNKKLRYKRDYKRMFVRLVISMVVFLIIKSVVQF